MELSEAIGKFVRIVDPQIHRCSTVQLTQSMADKAVNGSGSLRLSSLDRRLPRYGIFIAEMRYG